MHRYEVILYWSAEDGALGAEVSELLGGIAHGLTQEDGLGNAQEAVHLWIDTARQYGDPGPESKGRRLIFA